MAKKENGNATKSFILRVDAEMMEAIETWAADEFRSTNGQIQYILDQALRKAGRLKKKRKSKSEEEKADLVIVNTCSIRKLSEDKAYSKLGVWGKMKESNPNLRIGICGCVAQQEKENLLKNEYV